MGTPLETVSIIFVTLAAIASFAFAFEGYCMGRLRSLERLLFVVAAIALVTTSWNSRFAGLAVLMLLLLNLLRKRAGSSKDIQDSYERI
jgi:TRAP-type uncharacterized transport system fused permease subunit